ncbi:MAG TPA: hypothetical protein VKU82_08190 [Planctomycetaceae bacterium]|nr:hypothetical protein [Planctomycetaceae bacterium]
MEHPLIRAIFLLGESIWDLLAAVWTVLLPWTPLAAWVVFWMFAVNWLQLRERIARGGWVGLVLIAAIAVLVWGTVAPGDGAFDFFGLRVSNFVEKTVYVSGLVVIMFLAGAVQLSGCCAGCCKFDEPVQITDAHEAAHGGVAHAHNAGHGAH